MSEKKITIGRVGVDAGMVWIGDPCYVMGEDATSYVKTWEGFIEKLEGSGYLDGKVEYTEPLGRGVGFAVSSGWGDGSYPVTLTVDEASGRVKSLHVDFWGDEEDEEDPTGAARRFVEGMGGGAA